MGCGCGGKTAAEMEAETPGVRYSTKGSRGTVKLGLKSHYPLPLKFPKAIDGRDLLIVKSNTRMPPLGNTIVMVGRNAQIRPEHRDRLVARWPHAFEGV